jgi:energy-coupling factor transport system ATP-binding protein
MISAGEPVIVVEDVHFAYRRRGDSPVLALAGVSLTIRPGERLAILGHNGSGKSTLARLLNGLLLPGNGRVLVAGLDTRDAATRRTIRRTVGMVFQNPDNQLVAATVEEDVAFGPENLGLDAAEIRRRVDAALHLLDLWELRERPPHKLSGGQKQRVAIAGILAIEPDVLVLDEATALLDPLGRSEVRDAVRRVQAGGTAVVAATHHMEEAVEADRVLVMSEGRVVLEGPPREVFSEAGLLRELRLDVPPMAQIAERLVAGGVAVPSVLLDVPEAAAAIGKVALTPPAPLPASTDPHPPSTPPWGPCIPMAPSPTSGRGGATDVSPLSRSAGQGGRGGEGGAEPLIIVRDLHYTYQVGSPFEATALRGAHLELRAGEVAAIVGHSGSGKSTLIQHLNGLLRPQRGIVRVGGLDLGDRSLDLRSVRRRVGLVFQFPEQQLFEPTVGDDVAFGPRRLGCDREEVRRRVRGALDAVGLGFEAYKDRYTFGLSGGETRRVAIAGVLALEPDVLVLDEPTAGLDPRGRDDLLATLLDLRAQRGSTIAIVSHDMEQVAAIAERVWVMAGGLTVLSGTPREVFGQAEALHDLGLGLPQVTELMRTLAAQGLAVTTDAVTLDEAEEALWTLLAS